MRHHQPDVAGGRKVGQFLHVEACGGVGVAQRQRPGVRDQEQHPVGVRLPVQLIERGLDPGEGILVEGVAGCLGFLKPAEGLFQFVAFGGVAEIADDLGNVFELWRRLRALRKATMPKETLSSSLSLATESKMARTTLRLWSM